MRKLLFFPQSNMSINSKIVLNGLKKELPTVKIYEPFQPSVIECETKEDFSAIVNANINKYQEMTTQKLNKIFKIPGYKVTKVNNEICLRSIKPCEMLKNQSDETEIQQLKQQASSLREQINGLHVEINAIKEAFNQLSEQFETIKSYILGTNA